MSLPTIPAKPIQPKLLQLNAPTVRNQRTLIWLQHQTSTISWSKWDAIVTSLDDYHYWSLHNSKIVGLVISHLPEIDTDVFLEKIFTISKYIPLILLSNEVLSVKSAEYWTENFDNIIVLENAHEQYHFLISPWNKTQADAVAIFAQICRYTRLIDCTVDAVRTSAFRNKISLTTNCIPEQIWVITQYFNHSHKRRTQEIKECLVLNCANSHIDTIVLLTEKDYSKEWASIPGSTKIRQIVIGKRLTYANFLQYVTDAVPNNVFTILCNADIYFGNSLLDLWKINLQNKMLALLRWDDTSNTGGEEARKKATIFGPRADSQDTWIFHSNSIKDTQWNYGVFDFELGRPGCDNAFAGLILQHRFVISNPALTFKTYHLHNSNIRSKSKNTISSQLYVNIVPTYLIDTHQKDVPDTHNCICNQHVAFRIHSASNSDEITYCTMLEKSGRYKWKPSVENKYFEPAIPVYTWKEACVTPNGLVYDPYTIYIGKDSHKYPYWKDTPIDIFTLMQRVQRMFALPMSMNMTRIVFSRPDIFVLHYLSRCIRIIYEYSDAYSKKLDYISIWMPKQFEKYLTQLHIPEELQHVTYNEDTVCWADEVIGFVPGPLEFGREDINALRSSISNWIPTPSRRACCIVLDNIFTQEFVDTIVAPFFYKNDPMWIIRCIQVDDYDNYKPMMGANMCIFLGGHQKWARLWALPKYCCVVEFQQELKMDGEFQHFAHVSEFKPWVLLLSKGSDTDIRLQIIEHLTEWYIKNDDELIM